MLPSKPDDDNPLTTPVRRSRHPMGGRDVNEKVDNEREDRRRVLAPVQMTISPGNASTSKKMAAKLAKLHAANATRYADPLPAVPQRSEIDLDATEALFTNSNIDRNTISYNENDDTVFDAPLAPLGRFPQKEQGSFAVPSTPVRESVASSIGCNATYMVTSTPFAARQASFDPFTPSGATPRKAPQPVSFALEDKLDRQFDALATWANEMLCSTEFLRELDLGDTKQEAARKLQEMLAKPRKAPASEVTPAGRSYVEMNLHRKCSDYLKRAASVFESTSATLSKINTLVERNELPIRDGIEIFSNLGVQSSLLQLLFSYHPFWLYLGLETVCHARKEGPNAPEQQIPIRDGALLQSLVRFIVDNLFANRGLLSRKKFAIGTVKKMVTPAGKEAIHGHFLSHVLRLVVFVESAKASFLFEGAPRMFTKACGYKTSLHFCAELSRLVLSAKGLSLTKALSKIGFASTYTQSWLEEYEFGVRVPRDLGDGLNVGRLVELVLEKDPFAITSTMRNPGGDRLRKKGNVEKALTEAANGGIDLEGVTVEGVLMTGKEACVSLLWRLVGVYVKKTTASRSLRRESLALQGGLNSGPGSDEDDITYTICAQHAAQMGYEMSGWSSLWDGALLAAIWARYDGEGMPSSGRPSSPFANFPGRTTFERLVAAIESELGIPASLVEERDEKQLALYVHMFLARLVALRKMRENDGASTTSGETTPSSLDVLSAEESSCPESEEDVKTLTANTTPRARFADEDCAEEEERRRVEAEEKARKEEEARLAEEERLRAEEEERLMVEAEEKARKEEEARLAEEERLRAEEEERLRVEAEEKARKEEEARLAEEERLRAEEEERLRVEAEEKARKEEEVRLAEEERLRAEEEERLMVEAEEKARKEEEARIAEEERLRAEEEERLRVEAEEKARKEEEARLAKEERLRAEEEERMRVEAEEKARKEEEARLAEEERLRAEEEERLRVEAEEKARKEEEARLAEEERLRAEEEERLRVEAEEKARKEEEARLAEEERLRAEEEERLRVEAEEKARKEEEARLAEEERLRAKEEERQRKEEEARVALAWSRDREALQAAEARVEDAAERRNSESRRSSTCPLDMSLEEQEACYRAAEADEDRAFVTSARRMSTASASDAAHTEYPSPAGDAAGREKRVAWARSHLATTGVGGVPPVQRRASDDCAYDNSGGRATNSAADELDLIRNAVVAIDRCQRAISLQLDRLALPSKVEAATRIQAWFRGTRDRRVMKTAIKERVRRLSSYAKKHNQVTGMIDAEDEAHINRPVSVRIKNAAAALAVRPWASNYRLLVACFTIDRLCSLSPIYCVMAADLDVFRNLMDLLDCLDRGLPATEILEYASRCVEHFAKSPSRIVRQCVLEFPGDGIYDSGHLLYSHHANPTIAIAAIETLIAMRAYAANDKSWDKVRFHVKKTGEKFARLPATDGRRKALARLNAIWPPE